MTDYFSKSLRFERHGEIYCEAGTGFITVIERLIPVHSTSTLQPDGTLKCVRVTEVQFPLIDPAQYWEEVPFAPRTGVLIIKLLTTTVRSDVSGTERPILQMRETAPVGVPCLRLDSVALDVHFRDRETGFAGCDNPWVAELYGDDEEGEGDDE